MCGNFFSGVGPDRYTNMSGCALNSKKTICVFCHHLQERLQLLESGIGSVFNPKKKKKATATYTGVVLSSATRMSSFTKAYRHIKTFAFNLNIGVYDYVFRPFIVSFVNVNIASG